MTKFREKLHGLTEVPYLDDKGKRRDLHQYNGFLIEVGKTPKGRWRHAIYWGGKVFSEQIIHQTRAEALEYAKNSVDGQGEVFKLQVRSEGFKR